MDRYKKIKLLEGLEVQYFQKDQVIFKETEKGEYFYIIESGQVGCTKQDDNGEQTLIRTLGEGDYFGEIALTSDESKRTLSVTAIEDVKLLAMARDTFFQFIGSFSNYLQKDYKV